MESIKVNLTNVISGRQVENELHHYQEVQQ